MFSIYNSIIFVNTVYVYISLRQPQFLGQQEMETAYTMLAPLHHVVLRTLHLTCMRCLTSTELFVNCLFYVKYPILEQQHNKGAFSSIGNAFAMCLSDIALNSLAKDDLRKFVIAETYSNALNRQWSSFLCLLALSSAVKLLVEAYFQYPKMKPQKRRKIRCPPCLIAPSIHA